MATKYEGRLTIEPPLNPHEVRALTAFFNSRRIRTTGGPLDSRLLAETHPDVLAYNEPPEGQPGLHCDLEVSEDGKTLVWGEDDNSGPDLHRWITYVIDHLLKDGAEFSFMDRADVMDLVAESDLLWQFTFNHMVDGVIEAEAMVGDTWTIYVMDNEVSVVRPPVFVPMIATAEVADEDDGDDLDG